MFNKSGVFTALFAVFSLGLTTLVKAGSEDSSAASSEEIVAPGTPTFTLEKAILTALQQNPAIQTQRQEIERTKGIYIQFRGQALPNINANATFQDTQPSLTSTGGGGTIIIPGVGRLASGSGQAERQYQLVIEATQVVFAGGRIVSQIRMADFERDSSYYAFRNAVDEVVSTVKQQFYQIILNRELITVQEQSVNLLKSQLKDQQNRFEAGTVPRFNVLQAEVALSNQIPQLITAQNNYRLAKLALAKTLGINYNPNLRDLAPIEVVGQLNYEPRELPIRQAIEIAKTNRPFLKQQKANVLSNAEQVRVARSGFFPQINGTGGYEFRSSPFTDNIRDTRTGYIFGATGTWAIWDWGQTWGQMKQAKAVLQESKIAYDDAGRQVELEVQQTYSNMQQARETYESQEKNVEQAEEALRLAGARLDAGAGTQLEVLDARVQLTTAQSTRLQALYSYIAAVAEFDRVTATEVKFSSLLDEPNTREKLKTLAVPTPPPKPTPLPLSAMVNPPESLAK